MKFTKAAAALCALTMVLGAAAPVSGGVLGFDTAINASAADKPTSGKCGENVNWSLSSDGTITISGSGPMYDYDSSPFKGLDCTKIVVKGGVTRVGNMAFNLTGYYSSIVLENGVKEIGKNAFSDLFDLSGSKKNMTFSLPSSLTTIEDDAFRNNNYIKEITIPSGVTVLSNRTFKDCGNLTKVNLPSTLTRINDQVFYHCPLKTIELPNGLKHIGYQAFSGYNTFESLVIPDSVTEMGDNAFEYCKSVKSIVLPKGITAIAKGAFTNNVSLQKITIPGNVKVINNYAFSNCNNLSEVVLADGVADIRSSSFSDCANLKYVTIPKSVTTIANPGFPSGTTIRCYKGSAADNFFKDNKKYKIEYLDGTGTVKYGDVNKDGKVNDADVGLLQQYLADWKVTIDTAAADVTGDGKVNESDIGLLQQFLADWKVTLGK